MLVVVVVVNILAELLAQAVQVAAVQGELLLLEILGLPIQAAVVVAAVIMEAVYPAEQVAQAS
jgi:hypothetical protein